MIRFFERNYLSEVNPWSLRQTAIYQRLHVPSADASWILVRLSPNFKTLLKEKLKALHPNASPASHRHITIHVLALYYTLRNWRDFLMDHTSKLSEMVCLRYSMILQAKTSLCADLLWCRKTRQSIRTLTKTTPMTIRLRLKTDKRFRDFVRP
jgi:hypothetical protein